MRIESIHIQNYRLYDEVKLNLIESPNDMQIILGRNGVGKTTFLNAINWCLYGDEPHNYSSEERTLPISNIYINDNKKTFVEVSVKAKDGSKINFKRIYKNNYTTDFNVSIKFPNGESNFFKDEEADIYVEEFVPQAIRKFFFFDGEQLDNYFLEIGASSIEHNVSILSHIDVLERIESRLEILYKDFNREAGRNNPNIDKIREKLESHQQSLDKNSNRLKELQNDLKIAETKQEELSNELIGIPDVTELENQRNKLKNTINDLSTSIENKTNELNKFLVKNAPPLLLFSAIDYTLDYIDKKDQENQLPPKIDISEINESLEKGFCKCCGRDLDSKSIEYLENSKLDYDLSSDQSRILLNVKSYLKSFKNYSKSFFNKYNSFVDEIKHLNKIYQENNENLKIVEEKYTGFDSDIIKKKFKLSKDLENDIKEKYIQIGNTETHIKNLEKNIQSHNKELKKAMNKHEDTKILNNKKDVCSNAIDLISKTNNDIMKSTKKKIEDFTRETFFDLTWKKETYSDIVVDDSYNIKLIHSVTQKDALGSASAAERELLALAYTLGIHSISGFNSSLLIDTPLARVSDEHRVNFANVLLEISKSKQIILILTPAEFSEDIRELLDNEDIQKFKIALSNNEKTSAIKGA